MLRKWGCAPARSTNGAPGRVRIRWVQPARRASANLSIFCVCGRERDCVPMPRTTHHTSVLSCCGAGGHALRLHQLSPDAIKSRRTFSVRRLSGLCYAVSVSARRAADHSATISHALLRLHGSGTCPRACSSSRPAVWGPVRILAARICARLSSSSRSSTLTACHAGARVGVGGCARAVSGCGRGRASAAAEWHLPW